MYQCLKSTSRSPDYVTKPSHRIIDQLHIQRTDADVRQASCHPGYRFKLIGQLNVLRFGACLTQLGFPEHAHISVVSIQPGQGQGNSQVEVFICFDVLGVFGESNESVGEVTWLDGYLSVALCSNPGRFKIQDYFIISSEKLFL